MLLRKNLGLPHRWKLSVTLLNFSWAQMAHQILYQTLKYICFLTFSHAESQLNWKNGTIGDFSSEQLLHDPKLQQGFLQSWPPDYSTRRYSSSRSRFQTFLEGKLVVSCLWLQRVLQGIKRHQGSKRQHEPTTIELMHVIFQSLNFYNRTMLWAACCLAVFGFSHVVEFTVNSHFNPGVHIAVGDVQAESLVNSGSFRIYIKYSKMDPFCQGCYKFIIYIGAGKCDLCPMRALIQYLHVHGSTPGPLFLHSDGTPLNRQRLTSSIQSILSAAGSLLHWSQLLHCWHNYFSSLLWLTRSPHQDTQQNGSGYVSDLHTHSHHYYYRGSRPTHLTGITCASFSFPSCFCRVPQDFVSSGPGLPPALSPSSPLQSGLGSSESPFGLEWGLITGLRGFASYGGSTLSRG